MKKNLFILLLAVSVLFSFGGCKKTSEELMGSFSAKIGGTAWTSTLTTSLKYSDYITLIGTDLGGKKLVIYIHATQTGTYNFSALESQLNTYAVYFVNKDDETDGTKKYVTTTGTITITALTDNRISGTFSFQAANSLQDIVQITEGAFTNVLILSAK
jgi:hypothetical protein